MRHANTPLPTALTLDRLPASMRARYVLTLAADPRVETVEPTTEWTAPPAVYVFSELDHVAVVTLMLP